MTLLVVDSSVVLKWFVAEPYSTEAQSVLDAYQAGQYTFLAPDFIHAEVGNVIWKKQLCKELSTDEAAMIIAAFQLLTFQLISTTDLLEGAYTLAVKHQRTVYDMLYVALSIREACPFVTADEKLVNAVTTTISNVTWLGSWKSSSA